MTTKVEKSVLVNVPVSVAYNQWTQFEEFPQFMSGVKQVTQLEDDQLEWVAEILGVRRQWKARILEQVPDRKVAWAATEGATNAGSVTFEDLGGGQTSVRLSLEYEPEGFLEGLADKLHIVEKQAEGDLERFKSFIESEGYATGAWRGSINEGSTAGTPGVEDAAASRGDSGKAGVSGAAVAAGAAVVAGAAAAAAAAKKASDSGPATDQVYPPTEPPEYPATIEPDPTGTDRVFYPKATEPVDPLAVGLDPDLNPDAETGRRDDTYPGGVTPNPLS